MWMLEPLRAANRYVKAFRRARMGRHLSRVRRIERVYPPAGRRVVAMTFDDGPTASPARPGDGRGLTELILEALAKYGARGTFDVIGTTAGNYPDTGGKLGTPLWSGVKYDHYPEFGRDEMAGVVNQKALARRMVAEGHELSNHVTTTSPSARAALSTVPGAISRTARLFTATSSACMIWSGKNSAP